MSDFAFDEINLMCVYITGTRTGLMQELTVSTLRKLRGITDEQLVDLEPVPDFDTDEYGRCIGRSVFGGVLVLAAAILLAKNADARKNL